MVEGGAIRDFCWARLFMAYALALRDLCLGSFTAAGMLWWDFGLVVIITQDERRH